MNWKLRFLWNAICVFGSILRKAKSRAITRKAAQGVRVVKVYWLKTILRCTVYRRLQLQLTHSRRRLKLSASSAVSCCFANKRTRGWNLRSTRRNGRERDTQELDNKDCLEPHFRYVNIFVTYAQNILCQTASTNQIVAGRSDSQIFGRRIYRSF